MIFFSKCVILIRNVLYINIFIHNSQKLLFMKSKLLIRASAGSGKTRKLSIRYLELILQGAPISTVLASTFTRKATGEILNRILLTAAQACRDDRLRTEMEQSLERKISVQEMKGVLIRLVTALNQIRACSLNSFFHRIAMCFPYELGLKPGWRILDSVEENHLRWEAIQKTLEQNEKNAPTLIRQLFKGNSVNCIADDIYESMETLQTLQQEAGTDAWEAIQRLTPTGMLNEAELVEILNILEESLNYVASIHKGLIKSVEGILSDLRVNNWLGLLERSLIQQASGEEGSGPLTYSRKEISDPKFCSALIRLARHCVCAQLRLYQEQTRSAYTLIDGFAKNYTDEKVRVNGLCFDDVTRFVAEFFERQHGNMQPLYWRMNSPIEHLLLDEFQDTSLDQWHIFEPFGKYCTSSDKRSFFCVGDVKQAIYRWRNGRAEIFDAIERTFPGVEEEHSNVSWRSAPEILRCVNRLFLDGVKNPAEDCSPEPISSGNDAIPARSLLDDIMLSAWDRWQYERHEASPKSAKYPGYWELRTMPMPARAGRSSGGTDLFDDENDAEETGTETEDSPTVINYRWAANQIIELYRKIGPTHNIGVLFRTNKNVPLLTRFLREAGIPVSEEGKNPMTNSNGVRLILALLSFIEFPDSTSSWFLVGNSPLVELYPELMWCADADTRKSPSSSSARTACLTALRAQLTAFGIGHFVEKNAQFLKTRASVTEQRRLQQLVIFAANYDQTTRLPRIVDFVNAVRDYKLEDPSGAPVVVMSIHKSKGLQFDAVVLPDLNFSLKGRSPNFVPGYPENDVLQEVSIVTPFINQKQQAFLNLPDPRFTEACRFALQEQVSESLCLLYVAITRAVYGLYLFIPGPSESASGKSGISSGKTVSYASELLRLALSGNTPYDSEKCLAHDGDAAWFERTPKALKRAAEIEAAAADTQVSEFGSKNRCAAGSDSGLPSDSVSGSVSVSNSGSVSASDSESPSAEQLPPIQFRPSSDSSRTLLRRSPSNIEDRSVVDLGKKLSFRQMNTINGTILHSWYEKIAWFENSLPSDEELLATARQFGLSKDGMERLLKNFHSSLKSPRVDFVLHWRTYIPMLREKVILSGILPPEQVPATVLRKTPKDPSEIHWEVYCEKELAIRTENELLLGTVDRLILLRDANRVYWADCIDYKTTRKSNSDEIFEELVSRHQLQMQDYCEMLHRHYKIPTSQISTHLLFSMLGILREV